MHKRKAVQYLKKYIRGLNSDQISSHLLTGDIELRDAELEVAPLNAAIAGVLPYTFELHSVAIDSLRIQLPWSALRKKPVRAWVGRCFAKVEIHGSGDSAWAKLAAAREMEKAVDAGASAVAAAKPSGKKALTGNPLAQTVKPSDMVVVVVDGIEVSIGSIEIVVVSAVPAHHAQHCLRGHNGLFPAPGPAWQIKIDDLSLSPIQPTTGSANARPGSARRYGETWTSLRRRLALGSFEVSHLDAGGGADSARSATVRTEFLSVEFIEWRDIVRQLVDAGSSQKKGKAVYTTLLPREIRASVELPHVEVRSDQNQVVALAALAGELSAPPSVPMDALQDDAKHLHSAHPDYAVAFDLAVKSRVDEAAKKKKSGRTSTGALRNTTGAAAVGAAAASAAATSALRTATAASAMAQRGATAAQAAALKAGVAAAMAQRGATGAFGSASAAAGRAAAGARGTATDALRQAAGAASGQAVSAAGRAAAAARQAAADKALSLTGSSLASSFLRGRPKLTNASSQPTADQSMIAEDTPAATTGAQGGTTLSSGREELDADALRETRAVLVEQAVSLGFAEAAVLHALESSEAASLEGLVAALLPEEEAHATQDDDDAPEGSQVKGDDSDSAAGDEDEDEEQEEDDDDHEPDIGGSATGSGAAASPGEMPTAAAHEYWAGPPSSTLRRGALHLLLGSARVEISVPESPSTKAALLVLEVQSFDMSMEEVVGLADAELRAMEKLGLVSPGTCSAAGKTAAGASGLLGGFGCATLGDMRVRLAVGMDLSSQHVLLRKEGSAGAPWFLTVRFSHGSAAVDGNASIHACLHGVRAVALPAVQQALESLQVAIQSVLPAPESSPGQKGTETTAAKFKMPTLSVACRDVKLDLGYAYPTLPMQMLVPGIVVVGGADEDGKLSCETPAVPSWHTMAPPSTGVEPDHTIYGCFCDNSDPIAALGGVPDRCGHTAMGSSLAAGIVATRSLAGTGAGGHQHLIIERQWREAAAVPTGEERSGAVADVLLPSADFLVFSEAKLRAIELSAEREAMQEGWEAAMKRDEAKEAARRIPMVRELLDDADGAAIEAQLAALQAEVADLEDECQDDDFRVRTCEREAAAAVAAVLAEQVAREQEMCRQLEEEVQITAALAKLVEEQAASIERLRAGGAVPVPGTAGHSNPWGM